MTGTDDNNEAIHFLLLGNSKEHIIHVIRHFDLKSAVIFTSKNLIVENQSFIDEIEQRGVSVIETVLLDPFEENALENMIQRMLQAYEIHSNGGLCEVIAGLTGGTNLMVLAMGILCLSAGLKAHYILNNENNDLIEIDYFNKLGETTDLSNLKVKVIGGLTHE